MTTIVCTRYPPEMNPKTLEEALEYWNPRPTTIELWFSDYVTLPANAFLNYGDTEEVSVRARSVNHIEDGAFNGLFRLKRLSLPGNVIPEVRRLTFSGLSSLEFL